MILCSRKVPVNYMSHPSAFRLLAEVTVIMVPMCAGLANWTSTLKLPPTIKMAEGAALDVLAPLLLLMSESIFKSAKGIVAKRPNRRSGQRGLRK
jgi:hypothetical protein